MTDSRSRAALAALRQALTSGGLPPSSTYRLQFQRAFTFRDAAERVEYLHTLGVEAIYASPYLRARPDSTHGYDVSDHSGLNPAVGDEDDLAALAGRLSRLGMRQILDTVPNHMGIGEPSNAWWMDVLENGPSSIFADFFDINWQPYAPGLQDRVLLPILGDQYGRVLERGELRLRLEAETGAAAFFVQYWQTRLPISPRGYNRILLPALERLGERVLVESPDDGVVELQSITTAVRNLPDHHAREPDRRRERHREKEVVKRRLAALLAADQEIRGAIEAVLAELNGVEGESHSFDALDDLLRHQCYRLAFWRVASEEINYRRFFDVNDLAAIRMEHPEVYAAAHRLIFRLIDQGVLCGLRLDHPDGLWDPAAYFRRLQESHLLRSARRHAGIDSSSAEDAFDAEVLALIARARQDGEEWVRCPLFVTVEKILTDQEQLPSDWSVSGTVGYEYLNALGGLFVDAGSRRRFDAIYRRFVARSVSFEDLVYESKRRIMQLSLASEVNVLALQLDRISERNRLYRDFTLYALRSAVREVIACFPVYRTYVDESSRELTERDRGYVERAVSLAQRRNPASDPSIFEFIRDLLLLRIEGDEERRFVMKFQQTTGPVTAKGVEDTAFYIYNRLVSLNEVGGHPARFGTSPAEFHSLNLHRLQHWPDGLSTTSTHDTKRSEDVRTRMSVLSEIPADWSAALTRWSRRNRRKRRHVDGRPAPDRNEEYLLYQTLLGSWPLDGLEGFPDRIKAYMLKATREAKVNTSWVNPDEAWDGAVADFVDTILEDEVFVADFLTLQRRVAGYGMYNSLSQLLLKIASPGIPDFYQGQEIWDFSLVDPDNRRPVDYARRSALLETLVAAPPSPADLLATWQDGRVKLWITHRALRHRRAHASLYLRGAYRPLEAQGARAQHVVAFERRLADDLVVAVVPRLVTRLTDDPTRPPVGSLWGDDVLGAVRPGRYRDVLTDHVVEVVGGDVKLADVFADLPVALLERAPAG